MLHPRASVPARPPTAAAHSATPAAAAQRPLWTTGDRQPPPWSIRRCPSRLQFLRTVFRIRVAWRAPALVCQHHGPCPPAAARGTSGVHPLTAWTRGAVAAAHSAAGPHALPDDGAVQPRGRPALFLEQGPHAHRLVHTQRRAPRHVRRPHGRRVVPVRQRYAPRRRWWWVVTAPDPVPYFFLALTGTTTRLLTGSADTNAKLWDVETGKELFNIPHKVCEDVASLPCCCRLALTDTHTHRRPCAHVGLAWATT
jgi:hypothetical protein